MGKSHTVTDDEIKDIEETLKKINNSVHIIEKYKENLDVVYVELSNIRCHAAKVINWITE